MSTSLPICYSCGTFLVSGDMPEGINDVVVHKRACCGALNNIEMAVRYVASKHQAQEANDED